MNKDTNKKVSKHITPEEFCGKYKDILLPVLKRLADR